MTDLREPLARYAALLHATAGGQHHVASPLGAWLLAALCAPAADGVIADELARALGVDLAGARKAATALLDDPHPAVLSAAALWLAKAPTPAVDAWLAALPDSVETGPLPSQADADRWADEHTLGLIKRFPVALTHDTLLVLATALATKVTWDRRFDLAPAARLGAASPWRDVVDQVLEAPADEAFIARVPGIGEVAVHTAVAAEGMRVTSVIGPADVRPVELITAAHRLTHGAVDRRSLFDLPLGEGPLWTITEERVGTTAPGGREERYRAVLPAWSARSRHDLDRPELGIPAAAAAAKHALRWPQAVYEAAQSAMASYSREGFEAAAVSAMVLTRGAPPGQDGLRRTAELRFGHPYAVVAVADRPQRPHSTAGAAWDGLPVFSAWVAEPSNAA
ncbi:hypothetical protein SAMN05421684_2891 [Asanoa ishikariensis]|uniref:Serpin (Serine protease inhibitor) n=1 Tax=Asanoa ishikariensis TaxID=137265 RepID=A0A1H3PHV2_9ACTN|nr:hypothetical protein [Asanoa ishikariensis]SDZ00578.1 hypothetical protein SAMN05421684_2891 [Asanoa ishikariensis]